jgi:hypothetical protein
MLHTGTFNIAKYEGKKTMKRRLWRIARKAWWNWGCSITDSWEQKYQ